MDISINGYNFLEPRFYFSRKNKNTDRDKLDWKGMKAFFDMGNHKGYPFNQITDEPIKKLIKNLYGLKNEY